MATEGGEDGGGGDVEGTAAWDVGFEGAAADFSGAKKEPPGLVVAPHGGVEPVAGELVEGFAVEEEEAAEFGGDEGGTEVDLQF